MSEKHIEELIIRFIEGDCPDGQMQELLEWVKQCPENRDALFCMKNIYDRSRLPERLTEQQIDEGWARLVSECGISELPVETAGHVNNRVITPARVEKPRRLHRIRIAAAVAACFALIAGATLLYVNRDTVSTITFVNDSGDQRHLILPDGSGVWLYYGATLSYPEAFEDNIRRVHLTGEAFFDVVRDETSRFIVMSDILEVEVLGTRFNVMASDDVTQVVLESGSVGIGRLEKGNVVRKVLLNPGELGEANRSNDEISVSEVDLQFYTSWKDMYLNIKSQTLGNVAMMLSKRYNTSIVIESSRLRAETFTGRFDRTQSLEEIFSIINMTTPISYRQNGDQWIVTPRTNR